MSLVGIYCNPLAKIIQYRTPWTVQIPHLAPLSPQFSASPPKERPSPASPKPTGASPSCHSHSYLSRTLELPEHLWKIVCDAVRHGRSRRQVHEAEPRSRWKEILRMNKLLSRSGQSRNLASGKGSNPSVGWKCNSSSKLGCQKFNWFLDGIGSRCSLFGRFDARFQLVQGSTNETLNWADLLSCDTGKYSETFRTRPGMMVFLHWAVPIIADYLRTCFISTATSFPRLHCASVLMKPYVWTPRTLCDVSVDSFFDIANSPSLNARGKVSPRAGNVRSCLALNSSSSCLYFEHSGTRLWLVVGARQTGTRLGTRPSGMWDRVEPGAVFRSTDQLCSVEKSNGGRRRRGKR